MEISTSPKNAVVFEAANHHPSVSVIIPFEPKMSSKQCLLQSLEAVVKKVAQQMLEHYTYKEIMGITQKLKSIIAELNFNTHKKSIAIYASPVFEKVLYLDINVQEKVTVDNSFEIRNLVNSKKDLHEYLVLHLGSDETYIYHGNSKGLVKIVSNSLSHFLQNKIVDASPLYDQLEISSGKYLMHIDQTLNLVLNAYPFPLFIVGTENISTQFKQITSHASSVIDYIQGDFEELRLNDLINMLTPYITDWQKVKQKEIFNQLGEATAGKKLAMGMKDVWKQATKHRSRLLVIEKNYEYKAEQGSNNEIIAQVVGRYNKYSHIKDALDDVIEMVLEDGGDVVFVEIDLLNRYKHIALLQNN